MATDEDQLRNKAESILRPKPCMDIKFTLSGMTLMGYGYGYVAQMLTDGVIKVVIGQTHGFTARYDSSINTLFFGTRNPGDLGTVDGRGTVVHECTHAVVDATQKGKFVAFGNDEVAAYIAQTVYSLNAGDTINTVGPLSGPLVKIASKIRAYDAEGVYQVDPGVIIGV